MTINWNIIFKIGTYIIVAFTIFMMIFTIITVSTFDKNDRIVFGYRFYIVASDSMSLSEKNKDFDVHFNAGDIIVVKNVKEDSVYKPGEIISFMSMNSDSYGKTITHVIRRVEYTDEGKVKGYVTYGTNKDSDDEDLVEPEYVTHEISAKNRDEKLEKVLIQMKALGRI